MPSFGNQTNLLTVVLKNLWLEIKTLAINVNSVL